MIGNWSRFIGSCIAVWAMIASAGEVMSAEWSDAPDLQPVTIKARPAGEPVVLVDNGDPRATIVIPEKTMLTTAKELQEHIKLATGAELPIKVGQAEGTVIVLGDPEAAKTAGIDPDGIPPEGFEIKTFPGGVIIAGEVLWGVYEFLERFVGVRWYFPGDIGRDVPRSESLIIQPVWLADAPLLRKRENWPPNFKGLSQLHQRLRQGKSWPNRISCHTPTGWPEYYGKEHPEYFQMRADGSRQFGMLCYSNPGTLQQYLITIEEYYAGKYGIGERGKPSPGPWGGKPPDEFVIPVSPNDAPIACKCTLCQAKWDANAGRLGEASLIVADFVARLAQEVKKRWPDKTVTYLAYSNYTIPPPGIAFPGNVEVHVCGMRGIANYKEPAIAASEQAIIDGWYRISGRKLQNWHYSCWPADSTTAPYQFPHVLRDFYRANRDKTIGTFINGSGDHWPRFHVSLYCWMKLMWDPDFDVDAAIDEYCRRMYGPAAQAMRELVQLQIDGWENSRWTVLPAGANVSPKMIHEETYPADTVRKMQELLQKARELTADDELLKQRVEYYAGPLEVFFKESKEYHEGTGRTPLTVIKVGEDPLIDGRLTEPIWDEATPVSLIRALNREDPKPAYPTTLRAVWTRNGVSFGFHMVEPEPQNLVRKINVHDEPTTWWDDNVELFLDPAGQRAGFYQWIITANAAVFDGNSFGQGADWNPEGVKVAAYVGQDFWSVEVFIPFEVFRKEGLDVDPMRLAGKTWYGNFTRHRAIKPREMQRLNTTFEGSNHNMVAFGPIRFVE